MIKSKFIPGRPEPDDFEINDFFGGCLVQTKNTNYLIDTGVGSGIHNLINNLKKENINKLDYILLSHIHLDHGGGLFEIMKEFPESKVLCHEKGVRHLIDPGRLWESTKEVMGVMADMYGEPKGISPNRVTAHNNNNLTDFKIYETPGHAQHSIAFDFGEFIFVGEPGGCPFVKNNTIYQRPTTPPRYNSEMTKNSIKLLLSLNDKPAYFGHTSFTLPLHKTLNVYLKQLNFWESYIKEDIDNNSYPNEDFNEKTIRLTEELFQVDENLQVLSLGLTEIDFKREKHFLRNSVEGLILYFSK